MLKRKYGLFHRGIALRLLIIVVGMLFATEALAASDLTLASIQTHVSTGIRSVVAIMQDIALVAGIGFIFASFFKFHQHKLNPQQIPLSQGVTLLVIGAGLAVFPHLLNTTTQGVFGQSTTQLGGKGIESVVGGKPS